MRAEPAVSTVTTDVAGETNGGAVASKGIGVDTVVVDASKRRKSWVVPLGSLRNLLSSGSGISHAAAFIILVQDGNGRTCFYRYFSFIVFYIHESLIFSVFFVYGLVMPVVQEK